MTDPLVRQVQDNRFLQMGGEVATTLGATLRATFEQPMAGGLAAQELGLASARAEAFTEEQRVLRRQEQEARWRENDQLQAELLNTTDPVREDEINTRLLELQKEADTQLDGLTRESIDAGRMQEPDALAEQYGELGLTFDRPMSTREAELLAQGKREEIIRNAIIQSGPKGVAPTVARFGAGLAATAVDPLELASMFIPVVSPGRAAWLTAKLGKVGGRAAVGAIEGLVGSALTEPLYYGLSASQQLDYTMSDALMNIGLGAVLGGGIGAGVGALSRADVDAPRMDFDADRPLQRQAADVSLRQFATGQAVEVQPVQRNIIDVAEYRTDVVGSGFGQIDKVLVAQVEGRPAASLSYSVFEGEPKIDMIEVLPEFRRQGLAGEMLLRLQGEFEGVEIDWGSLTTEGAKLYKATKFDVIPSKYAGEFKRLDAIQSRIGELREKISDGWGLPENRGAVDEFNDIRDEFDLLTDVLDGKPREARVIASGARTSPQRIPADAAAELARHSDDITADPLANVEASIRADTPAPETFVADTLDDMEAMVAELDKAGALDADMKADLDAVKEIEIKSRSYRAATEAASACLVGG